MTTQNFAARAGGWSAAHWKTATFGWLAFVAITFLIGTAVGTHALGQSDSGDGEAGRALRALGQGFPQPAHETVLVRSRSVTVADPQFRAVVTALVDQVSNTAHVASVRSPLDTANAGQISKDGHSAIVLFDITGRARTAKNRVAPALDTVAALQRAHLGFSIRQAGDASADRALSKMLGNDFKRAERLALPITLLIMLFAFGALVAAAIPVLLAFSGVTVLVAVAGMLLSGDPGFKSIGIGTMVVVACAIVGSLTVLPALMHKLGDRVEKGRIPLVGRLRSEPGRESRLWGFVLDLTLRRPALSAALAAGVLVAATIPAFSLQTKFPSINDLPRSIPIVNTVVRLTDSFPGTTVPAVVVVNAPNVRSDEIQRQLLEMRDAAIASGQMTLPVEISRNPANTVARVTIPIKSTDSRSDAAYAALKTLR